MNELKCIECNKLFIKKYSRQICCSNKCSKQHRKTYNKIFNRSYSKTFRRKQYMKQYLKSYGPKYKKTNKYKKYLKTYKPSEITLMKRKLWRQTPKAVRYRKEYNKSEGWKKSHKKWITSKNGRMISRMLVIKRRAILTNIVLNFTQGEWLNKLRTTKGICPMCNKYISINKLTLDHKYPVSLAHKNFLKTGIKRIYTIDDVQPLCTKCNSSKNNKIII